MEYKARLMTTRERYGSVTDVTLGGVADIIGKEGSGGRKGVYQLAKVITKLLAGEGAVSGSPKPFQLQDSQKVYPVLVTYEESVGLEAVRQQAEAKFVEALRREGADAERVGRLLILTVEEVEILEALAVRHSPEAVIRDYVAHVVAHPKDPAGSFRTFIGNGSYGKNSPLPRATMVGECYSHALGWIGEELEARHAAANVARAEAGAPAD
jgi:hypothetical protein